MKFAVASFTKEGGSIHVVPCNWLLSNTKAQWPIGLSASEIKRKIAKCDEIPDKWNALEIKIYCYRDSFELAEAAADKYCITSNPSSSGEITNDESQAIPPRHKLWRKKRAREDSESDSDPDDLPECSFEKNGNDSSKSHEPNIKELKNTPVSNTNTSFAEKVFQLLVRLKRRINRLEEKIDKQNKTVENKQGNPSLDPIIHQKAGYNFPISQSQQMEDLEANLAQEDNAHKLCLHLSTKPSKSMRQMVLVLFKYLLSRDMALKYNLNGQRGKLKFSDLLLSNIIIAAIRTTYPDASTGEILKRMSCVLAGARDWDGERKKRIREE